MVYVYDDYMDDIVDIELSEEKADIFCPDDGAVCAASSADAYVYSMRELGRVDLTYMSDISGRSKEELVNDLIGKTIWSDPEKYEASGDYYGSFVSKQQYCRGNLIKKYAKAKTLNDKYGLFDMTLELLKDTMPDYVEPEDIRMNLGSTWIPRHYVIDFVYQLLDMFMPPRIDYNEFLGKWIVECPIDPNYVKNNCDYGTGRMSAINIIKHILNAKPVIVYDQVPKKDGSDGKDNVINKVETLSAQQKEKLIQDAWQDYIHGDSRVEAHLQEVYMDSYGYGLSRYDGAFLELAELNPDIKLYVHQKNAIARIVLNHNTLLAHEVGAGKTIEYMCGVHELIRMNLGKKAMIVLPNTTFDSAVNTYLDMYKDDSVLAVYPKKDFRPAKREETLAKVKSDKYKVIFMAYSSFDMITLSKQYTLKKKEERLVECREEIDHCQNYATKKALITEKKKLEKAVKKYKDEFKVSETACFDELGIDILVVDESHNYKNISLGNMTDSIVGVHNAGSKKADHMLEKVEYIQSVDGHVIFATGTPITNSMADLYVLQRYLQPEELKMCRIYHFNDWISTFCSRSHTFEIDVDSKNFRFTTRFSKFHNLPEIMSMFSDVCDFYRIDNGELGLPDFEGYADRLVKMSDMQREYIDQIAERTEDIRAHRVKPVEDNLLKITVDGKKCALDIRLVVPEAAAGNEDTKVKVCAGYMAEIYFKYAGTTQIAFADISTPKEDFNIYDELKKELVKNGLPASEIMFIHDAVSEAQRNRLEKRFNAGEIRVLIGSTMKLGTGCNVQERLIAVHHLDVPWRPADMVQREGRIIRQGNRNPFVYVYRYVTEASFDSYTWQILENKQRFIAQFLSGTLSGVHRDESDCADTVLDYAEIKALAIGNPLIKERVEVSNELEHAKINQRQKRKELGRIQELSDGMPARIKIRKLLIHNAEMDEKFYKETKRTVPMEERRMFGEKLLFAVHANVMIDEESVFGSYQGFDVVLPKHMKIDRAYVIVRRPGSNRYSVKMDGDKALGVCRRLDHLLDTLGDTVRSHEEALADLLKQQENAARSLQAGNEFDELVDQLSAKLADIDEKLKEGKAP